MIDLSKKYQTKSGLKVDILAVKGSLLIVAVKMAIDTWDVLKLSLDGVCPTNDQLSIVEFLPFSDIAIDDKCVFWNKDGINIRGHFAGIIDGAPYRFDGGKTSYTGESKTAYENCKKNG
jgi:hypothetical protein